MLRTNKMKLIEERKGQKIEEILADLYLKYGSQTKVAEHLGVSQGTVSNWLIRLQLQEWTILQPIKHKRHS